MRSKRSPHEQKRRDLTPFFIVILLFPYIAGFTSDSTSSYTETLIGIGTGEYVYQDCSGTHSRHFRDVGLYYGKKFEGPYRLGLNIGGWNAADRGGFVFAYPDLALDWEKFSIGTTGIRIGRLQDMYFEIRSMDQPPFFSGKGVLRTGLGGTVDNFGTRFWIGTNVIPYNRLGLATQFEFPFQKNTFLFINGRYGGSSGMEEFGLSIGLRITNF